ncbi:MAG: S1C family serine protease, partial [Betaproteobacteria bacterium]
ADMSIYSTLINLALLRKLAGIAIILGLSGGVANAVDLSAQTAFQKLRPSVVEVRVEVKGNLGTSAAASGFVTLKPDLVVTNYHVIHEALYEPEEHRIVVELAGSRKLAARIVALDVINDLAVLRLEKSAGVPMLPLRGTHPAEGEKGFSMGKPGGFEVGIVTGTFNGVTNDDPKTLLVFSGAINRGMSGGPLLDAGGRVVGINVATSARHQLVGMAVPPEYLIKLLKSLKPEKPPSQEELLTEVTVQAIAFGRYQMKVMNKISHPERALGPFSVHGDFNTENPCRTERSSHPSQPYTEVEQGCQAGVGVYLMPGRHAGRMQSEAVWMHSKSLSSLQMSSLLTRRINSSRTLPESQRGSAAWACRQQRLKTPDGLPVQIYACRRPVKHLPDLHDYKFRYAPLVSGPDALMVSLELTGMDRGSAQAVLGLSLASLRWQPAEAKAP